MFWLIKKVIKKGTLAAAEVAFVRQVPLPLNPKSAFLQLTSLYAVTKKLKNKVENYFDPSQNTQEEPEALDIYTVDTPKDGSVLVFNDDRLFSEGQLKLPQEIQEAILNSEDNFICIFDKNHKYREPKPKKKPKGYLSSAYDSTSEFLARDMTESAGGLLGGAAAVSQFAAAGGLGAFVATPALLALPAAYLAEIGVMYIGSLTAGAASKYIVGDNLLLPALKSGKKYVLSEPIEPERPIDEEGILQSIELDDFKKKRQEQEAAIAKSIQEDWSMVEMPHPAVNPHIPSAPPETDLDVTPVKMIEDYINVPPPPPYCPQYESDAEPSSLANSQELTKKPDTKKIKMI